MSLAEKYNVTPTQIIFAWHLSRGTVIIPKSENDQRQKENIAVRPRALFLLPAVSGAKLRQLAVGPENL